MTGRCRYGSHGRRTPAADVPQAVTPSLAVAHAALALDDPEKMRAALASLLRGIETGQLPDLDGFGEIVTLVTAGAYAKGREDEHKRIGGTS